jgi:hypothetical protein
LKSSIYIPDELAERARLAGVNLSATLRSALLALLESPDMPALAAVDRVIEGLDVADDAVLGAQAELARALAAKLDLARHSHSAAMALAAATIVRELRSVIDVLADDSPAAADFVASLFEGVDGSAAVFP